jgi:nucleotide-binding universal stress UspA family protein
VVAGIDGSPGSLATPRRAVAQARLRHAALEVVHAIPDNASANADAEARAMLDRIITQEYPEGLTVPVRLRVERGEPAQVLARASAGAGLLVLSGESGPGDQGMPGDILRRVLRTAACPVDTCAADIPRS